MERQRESDAQDTFSDKLNKGQKLRGSHCHRKKDKISSLCIRMHNALQIAFPENAVLLRPIYIRLHGKLHNETLV